MRNCYGLIVCALAVVALAATPRPAAARATCDELLAVVDTGQSIEAVAETHYTTPARVEACIRLAQQKERFTEQRARFTSRRLDRGLTH